MWNGVFSPEITKHRDYCGDIRNHIYLGAGDDSGPGWQLDGNILTVEFAFNTGHGETKTYTAEIELEWEEVEDGVDDEMVKELIAFELGKRVEDRRWI